MPADIICVYVECGWELGKIIYKHMWKKIGLLIWVFLEGERKRYINGFHIKTFEEMDVCLCK